MAVETGTIRSRGCSGLPAGAIQLPWEAEPRRLWSLLDMIRCQLVDDVLVHLRFLDAEISRCSVEPFDLPVTADAVPRLVEGLLAIMSASEGFLPLADSTEPGMIISRLREGVYTQASLRIQLQDLRFHIQQTLAFQKFVFIPRSRAAYFDQEMGFGEAVHEKFPETREDIKNAGNSIAADLDTAAVYYLMRVSEYGLRRLAAKLRVSLRENRKPCPIEYATWNKVIDGCHRKLNAAHRTRTGPTRQARLAIYADAADHCLFMKDIWRNNTSHTRQPYRLSEAVAAFDRVRDFMRFLAYALEPS